jgi:plasmid stabilization system protein ParE
VTQRDDSSLDFGRIVLPEAEDEIREAMLWYEARRSGLGMEFLGVVEDAMARVTSTPRQWPQWNDDPRYRRMVLRRFPYLLFYEIRGDTVEFVAVAHTRRRPGYWLARLGTPNEP